MSTSPAAWHPDPLGRHEFRYWDGKVWTQHVANGGQASVDPIDHGSPAQTDLVRASNEIDSSTAISAPKHGFVSRLMDDRRAKAESRSEFEALVLAAARGN